VESRDDKRPQLSDLRESGSIEQDADMVMFLYRPEYYGITEDESGNPTTGIGEVIIAKHRNGSLDTVGLKFIGKYTKFMDRDGTDFIGLGALPGAGNIPAEFDEPGTIRLGSRANTLPPAISSPEDELPPF
jgi:replicative DNA helicase